MIVANSIVLCRLEYRRVIGTPAQCSKAFMAALIPGDSSRFTLEQTCFESDNG